MKVRKAMAIVLACTMLMGQTVWAQEVQAEPETQSNEEMQEDSLQEDSEQEAQQTDENAEVIAEEETDLEESVDETAEEDAAAEKEIAEKSVYTEADTDIETEEITICVSYPIMVDSSYGYSGDSVYSVESADESICKVTGATYEEEWGNGMYFILEGVSPGKTMISLKLDESVVEQYEVTVNELPDDAVMFNDMVLRTILLYGDSNDDGCINKNEMENVMDVSMPAFGMYTVNSIKDLSGLEYATNLKSINLWGCTELTDIEVLFRLGALQSVDLSGTNVSDEDRWRLADFKDCSIVKGEKILLPSLGCIFEEGLEIEIISGDECVEIAQSDNTYDLIGKEAGESVLKISYHNLSAEVTVTIQGISAEQEVGEKSNVKITIPNGNAYLNTDKSLILDSNNQLWQTYPSGEKIADNVKEYVAGWIYYGDDNSSEKYAYILDINNVLWNNTTKLAEDVVKFDGRYTLDNNGILKNIYNSGSEQIENVEDWISPAIWDEGVAYILKKDGTLWKRQEVAADQTLLEWELVDSNVQQIVRGSYLKQDGTIVMFDGTEVHIDEKVSKICSDGTYYDSEGNYYCSAYYSGVNSETGEYEDISGYRNVGKLDIKSEYSVNGATYLLTQDNDVYKYDVRNNTTVFLVSDVVWVQPYGLWEDMDLWAFKLRDNTYCDLDGNPMSEVQVTIRYYEYKIVAQTDDTKTVERNGVAILNGISDVWGEYEEDGNFICFALRTDGTVWNITGIPEQVLDLNQTEEEIKGDLNGDSEINLLDLMQCLNHVSKKSLLEGSTYTAADIDGNGTVDLLDLMRILNYVSKKTDTL